jgi:uncharacterized protein YeaO (DUF488 family)
VKREVSIKRAYSEPSTHDGQRILVDRLWPRGLTKEAAKVDVWMKELAPSTELRKWFDHRADRWPEFQKRYAKELDRSGELVSELVRLLRKKKVTLVFGAKDEEHNQAVALAAYLEVRTGQDG